MSITYDDVMDNLVPLAQREGRKIWTRTWIEPDGQKTTKIKYRHCSLTFENDELIDWGGMIYSPWTEEFLREVAPVFLPELERVKRKK